MGKPQKKKKKTKVTYVDDGSRIADMSALGGRRGPVSRENLGARATYGEMFRTYIAAVKMMFLPMLAVLGIIAIAFLLVYLFL